MQILISISLILCFSRILFIIDKTSMETNYSLKNYCYTELILWFIVFLLQLPLLYKLINM